MSLDHPSLPLLLALLPELLDISGHSTYVRDLFTSASPFTTVTLTKTPASGTVFLYLNGLYVESALWSIVGSVVTFGSPMGAGDLVAVYQTA
jgi:hypothetical protein